LSGLDLEIVLGDARDRDSLRRALKGCTWLYHLAAPTGHDRAAAEIIVRGTKAVLQEAARSQVERAVVTSSTVTIGYSHDPSMVLDENSNRRSSATPYHAAKWEAEHLAIDFARRNLLAAVIVNPCSIVGSLDFRVTPSNAPIQRCMEHGLPIAFNGGMTVAHAADVALGHILAMENGVAGERYILGGDRLTIPDYFALIARICGRQGPRVVAPRWAILGLGLAANLARALGLGSVLPSFGQVRTIADRYAWYSSEKARSSLHYRWRPAAEAITDYVDWARSARTQK
jgi:dihydroflavonol-4-reductase